MKPLWKAAKNTVDGGIKELKEIISDRRKKSEAEPETLKLEVVQRDLQILSMVNLNKRNIYNNENILDRNLISTLQTSRKMRSLKVS